MSDNTRVSAFTSRSNVGIQRRLLTPVSVSNNGKSMSVTALWDTGATGTCISYDVVNSLGLIATGKQNIRTPSGGSTSNTYLVTITLPNNVMIPNVVVFDSEIGNQGIGMLIGMDIITKGDLAVSNHDGCTVFSFRIPSCKVTDYVEQHRIREIIGTHGKGKKKKR